MRLTRRPFVITVDFDRLCRSDPRGLSAGRILDVGCGTGRHMTAALRFPEAKVVGADIDIDAGYVVARAPKGLLVWLSVVSVIF